MTDDIAERFTHRLAVMLECTLLSETGSTWQLAHELLDEYYAALYERDKALGIGHVSAFGKD